jgi:hypothetical protein
LSEYSEAVSEKERKKMEKPDLSSPFLATQTIHDVNMFFGRGELFKLAYSIIGASGSLSLVGPPRIGKGSFLCQLGSSEMQERYGTAHREKLSRCVFVFMDIRTCAQKNWDDFFKALNKEIVTQCKGLINVDAAVCGGSEGFSALLEAITAQLYHPVLAFDSFEKLRENDRLSGPLPTFLRSEGYRVSYVVASTIRLDEIFVNEPLSSPFYNIFDHREIGILASADARKLVMTPAEKAGLPFSAREVDWVIEQGGGHPFFLQRVSRALFEVKAAAPEVEPDLEQVKSQAYQMLLPHFKSLWKSVDGRQQERMCYQLQKPGAPEFYESALFQRFVKAQCGDDVTIELQDIKDALKSIGDLSRLSESRLRHLEIVRERLQAHAQPTEIGFAIREVLSEATKRLEGNGTRSDTAPDWEGFNILHYCYFKHRMQSKALSARLSMSTRTLFRKKEEAFKKLLIALQEMETAQRNS